MARDIDTTLLRTFHAVVDAGGMTQAAKRVHRTQAAVSQQIKRLEEQLGQSLFDRSQRSLRLTPSGEQLHSYAQRMLCLNDEIWDSMTSPIYEGTVRLGIPHDLVLAFAPCILRTFSQRRPRVQIVLTCGNTVQLKEMVDNDEIDLTLTTEAEIADGDTSLLEDELVWIGAPGTQLLRASPVPIAIGGGDCAFRPHLKRSLEAVDKSWRIVVEDPQMDPLFAICEADLAVMVTLVSTMPSQLEVLDGSELGPLPTFFVNLHERAGETDAIVNDLATHVKEQFNASAVSRKALQLIT